jgi:hypothetical protein
LGVDLKSGQLSKLTRKKNVILGEHFMLPSYKLSFFKFLPKREHVPFATGSYASDKKR